MNRAHKLFALAVVTLAGSFIFAAIAPNLAAQGVGGVVEAAYFRVLNTSGNAGWRIKVDSSNRLTAENLDTARPIVPLSAPNIDNATGGIRFAGYTSAQIATLQSPGTGYMIWVTNAVECGGASTSYAGCGAAGSGGRLAISTWTTGGTGSGLAAWTRY